MDLDAPAAIPGPTTTTARCADVLARLLPRWLPRNLDLYVIGVQECACLPRLREILRGYLNDDNDGSGGSGGSAYAMYKTEIGDDQFLHGFIALTLFVREGDVASGAFQLHRAGVGGVATGVDLGPMGRAANKVGLAGGRDG